MTATPPLEDDVKPIRDALAPFAWCIESLDSADWCWSASVEGVKLNAELLDPGCTPSEPFAVVRKSDHDERIARLLAHIDAQAVRLDAAERDAERYQLLRRGQHWSVIDGIGDILRGEALDAAIDAHIAAIASEAKP